MDVVDIKLECVRLALGRGPCNKDLIEVAADIYEFVAGQGAATETSGTTKSFMGGLTSSDLRTVASEAQSHWGENLISPDDAKPII